MTLIEFKDLLLSVCKNVSHCESATGEKYPRIVYAETGRNYYYADNKVAAKKYKVDVHFYTIQEYDPMFEALEDLFVDNNIPFDLDSIKYGSNDGGTRVVYYLFSCEV